MVCVGVGQFKSLNVGLGNIWAVLSITPLELPPSSKGPDQIFQAHGIRAISLTCMLRIGIKSPFGAANNRVSFPKAIEVWGAGYPVPKQLGPLLQERGSALPWGEWWGKGPILKFSSAQATRALISHGLQK